LFYPEIWTHIFLYVQPYITYGYSRSIFKIEMLKLLTEREAILNFIECFHIAKHKLKMTRWIKEKFEHLETFEILDIFSFGNPF